MTRYELSGPDASFSVEAVREGVGFRVTIGDTTYFLKIERTDDPGVLVAQIEDKPLKVTLEEATSQRVALVIEGERLLFEKPLPITTFTRAIAPVRSGQKDLVTPMPGRVIGTVAKVGDRLHEGDPVVIIESMKMETVIRSDRDAEVEEVLVAEGAIVKRGQPLVRFATEGPS